MTHDVEISAEAFHELEAAYHWLALRSAKAADDWRASLKATIATLADHPERCPLAPESDRPERELRQLLHGKGRRVYRILFEIIGTTVYVLRIRHAAQRPLRPGEF